MQNVVGGWLSGLEARARARVGRQRQLAGFTRAQLNSLEARLPLLVGRIGEVKLRVRKRCLQATAE